MIPCAIKTEKKKSQFTWKQEHLRLFSSTSRVFVSEAIPRLAPLPTLHLSPHCRSPACTVSAEAPSAPDSISIEAATRATLAQTHLFSFIVPSNGAFFSAVFSLGYVLSSVPPSCLTPSPPRYKTVTMLIRRQPRNPLISALLRRSSGSWKNIRPGRFGRVGF